jgi:DNA polymerase-3 subunit epsilon
MSSCYAVVDLETTGLTPRTNRVIEVGVVLVDATGEVQETFGTLVNPHRDLGPTSVHGVRAADARRSPSFADIAGYLTQLLDARVLVSHNLAFDLMFLQAEYARLGVELPVSLSDGLCTMSLAGRYLGRAGRSLGECCAAVGHEPMAAHEALEDAKSAARLLAWYLAHEDVPPPWQHVVDRAAGLRWPAIEAGPFTVAHRGTAHSRGDADFLGRIACRLPRSHEPAFEPYLAVLDQALLDRLVSDTEADELVELAVALGLDQAQVLSAHRTYLDALITVAQRDGVVTEEERADIGLVARLLGFGDEWVDAAITAQTLVPAQRPATTSTVRSRELGTFELRVGDLVVFTGEMQASREEWQSRALAAGLAVNNNVTKRTRLVVAADPDSMSGKARKARDYGLPVVTESAFIRLLAAMDPRGPADEPVDELAQRRRARKSLR